MSPQVELRTTALVLIDFQNDVLNAPDGQRAAWAIASRVIEHAARAVEACRARGMPIVWVKVERRPDLADVANLEPDLVRAGTMPPPRATRRLLAGTPGAAIVDELAPRPDEDVVVKRRVSGFHATPLDLLLRTRGVRTLLVGGVHTENGVESTVRAAWDRDYQVVVLADCCASPNPAGHHSALNVTLPRFARILPLDPALDLFADAAGNGEAHTRRMSPGGLP